MQTKVDKDNKVELIWTETALLVLIFWFAVIIQEDL